MSKFNTCERGHNNPLGFIDALASESALESERGALVSGELGGRAVNGASTAVQSEES